MKTISKLMTSILGSVLLAGCAGNTPTMLHPAKCLLRLTGLRSFARAGSFCLFLN